MTIGWVLACVSPYLLLSVQPLVDHGVVGTEGGAGQLPLELARPAAGVPRQAAVGVGSSGLRRNREEEKVERLPSNIVTVTPKLLSGRRFTSH